MKRNYANFFHLASFFSSQHGNIKIANKRTTDTGKRDANRVARGKVSVTDRGRNFVGRMFVLKLDKCPVVVICKITNNFLLFPTNTRFVFGQIE